MLKELFQNLELLEQLKILMGCILRDLIRIMILVELKNILLMGIPQCSQTIFLMMF